MSSPDSSPSPQRWQRLGAKPLTSTRIFTVDSVTFSHPSRPEPRDFVVINAPDWVNVIALTPDGKMVLVRQFRYGINEFSLEIPGGVIDHVGRAVCHVGNSSVEGWGLFEHGALGRHDPSGFADWLTVAP